MKKLLSILCIIIITLFTNTIMGQITPYLEQITVDNIPISDCSTIAFGSNSSVNLSLKLRITKSSANNVGDFATLKLYIKKNSSSTPQFINGILINNSAYWNQGTLWEGVFSQTLQASDIDVTGSVFYGIYEISTNLQPKTCEYALTKSPPPSFTLSPTSLMLACGDTSARSFSVTPANIPSGSTVTYQWSASGWSGDTSPSLGSVTLTPTSATTLPSNVSVTPFLNGISQGIRTCTIARAPFTSSATISGPTTLCSSATYSISNLLPEQTVSWSIQGRPVATLSATSGLTTTLTRVGNGTVNLIATLTNACGQTFTLPAKTISIGLLDSPTTITGPTSVYSGALANYQISPVTGATSYEWWLPYPYETVEQFDYFGQNWQKLSSSTDSSIQVFTGYAGTAGYVQAMAVNDCGIGGASFISVTHGGSGGAILRLSNIFTIYPNPSGDLVTIDIRDKNNQPPKDATITGELFDMMGQSKVIIQIANKKAKFSVVGLPIGIYVLKIYMNNHVESHQLAVE